MKLGEILRASGAVTEDELQRGLERGRAIGQRLGSALVALGIVDHDVVAAALAQQKGVDPVRDRQFRQVPAPVLALLPAEDARRSWAVPIAFLGDEVVVAMRDPDDATALANLRDKIGRTIKPGAASEGRLRQALEGLYSAGGRGAVGRKSGASPVLPSGAPPPARARPPTAAPERPKTPSAPPAQRPLRPSWAELGDPLRGADTGGPMPVSTAFGVGAARMPAPAFPEPQSIELPSIDLGSAEIPLPDPASSRAGLGSAADFLDLIPLPETSSTLGDEGTDTFDGIDLPSSSADSGPRHRPSPAKTEALPSRGAATEVLRSKPLTQTPAPPPRASSAPKLDLGTEPLPAARPSGPTSSAAELALDPSADALELAAEPRGRPSSESPKSTSSWVAAAPVERPVEPRPLVLAKPPPAVAKGSMTRQVAGAVVVGAAAVAGVIVGYRLLAGKESVPIGGDHRIAALRMTASFPAEGWRAAPDQEDEVVKGPMGIRGQGAAFAKGGDDDKPHEILIVMRARVPGSFPSEVDMAQFGEGLRDLEQAMTGYTGEGIAVESIKCRISSIRTEPAGQCSGEATYRGRDLGFRLTMWLASSSDLVATIYAASPGRIDEAFAEEINRTMTVEP